MIRGVVEGMLGEAGRFVLRLYEQNALLLGLIIVAYGILMFLAWQNLIHIYRFLVQAAAASLAIEPEKPAAPEDAKRHRRGVSGGQARGAARRAAAVDLPWQAAVDSVRFPFVSPRAGLWPHRKSVLAVKKIVDERELWDHARAVAAGADVRNIAPVYRLASRRQTGTDGKD